MYAALAVANLSTSAATHPQLLEEEVLRHGSLVLSKSWTILWGTWGFCRMILYILLLSRGCPSRETLSGSKGCMVVSWGCDVLLQDVS